MYVLMWILQMGAGWPKEFWGRKGLSVRIPTLPLAFTLMIPSQNIYISTIYYVRMVSCGRVVLRVLHPAEENRVSIWQTNKMLGLTKRLITMSAYWCFNIFSFHSIINYHKIVFITKIMCAYQRMVRWHCVPFYVFCFRFWLFYYSEILLFFISDGTDCSVGEFECVLDHLCVPFKWTCDGEDDCGDQSDEDNALCEGQNITTRLPPTTNNPCKCCPLPPVHHVNADHVTFSLFIRKCIKTCTSYLH